MSAISRLSALEAAAAQLVGSDSEDDGRSSQFRVARPTITKKVQAGGTIAKKDLNADEEKIEKKLTGTKRKATRETLDAEVEDAHLSSMKTIGTTKVKAVVRDDSSDDEESRTSSITQRSKTIKRFRNDTPTTSTTSSSVSLTGDAPSSIDRLFSNVNLNMTVEELKKKSEDYEAKKMKSKLQRQKKKEKKRAKLDGEDEDTVEDPSIGVLVSRETKDSQATSQSFTDNTPNTQNLHENTPKSFHRSPVPQDGEVRIGRDGKPLKFRPNGMIKTKKRSKQKNIRKDNRPSDQKPEVGQGWRSMTTETKKHMGLN